MYPGGIGHNFANREKFGRPRERLVVNITENPTEILQSSRVVSRRNSENDEIEDYDQTFKKLVLKVSYHSFSTSQMDIESFS